MELHQIVTLADELQGGQIFGIVFGIILLVIAIVFSLDSVLSVRRKNMSSSV